MHSILLVSSKYSRDIAPII